MEGWLAEGDMGSSSEDEPLVTLVGKTMGLQFKVAQDEEDEFAEICEQEVSRVEYQVLCPEIQVSDPRYEICGGLLYHVKKEKVGDEEVWQLLVPHSFKKLVWKLAHTSLMGGHFGQDNTVMRVSQCFFWPGIHAEIAHRCEACKEC